MSKFREILSDRTAFGRLMSGVSSKVSPIRFLDKASTYLQQDLSPPLRLAAMLTVSTFSLSFASFFLTMSLEDQDFVPKSSRVRWIPVFCAFRFWDHLLQRRLAKSSYGFLALIHCINDLIHYAADGTIRKYTVYLNMMCLDPTNLIFLLDDFDSKWMDVRPRFKSLLGKRGVFGISAMSVLDILISLMSQLSVMAWIIYRAIQVCRYLPDVRNGQLESEQGIQTYQRFASGGAVIHLVLSSGLFLMETCSVTGTISESPPFLSVDSREAAPMIWLSWMLRHIFDILLVGYLIMFSAKANNYYFFLIIALLFSGWFFNSMLVVEPRNKNDHEKKAQITGGEKSSQSSS